MELRYYPDRVLRKPCAPVREVDDELAAKAQRMLEFMYDAEGIGLAANQVGWSHRIVTLDVELARQGTRIFINPRIVNREGHVELEEGCLSLPGVRLAVPRAEKVAVVAYTLEGERVETEAEGLEACAWQHELDHLNGVLIIDKVPPTRLMAVRGQLKQLAEGLKSEGRR